MSSQNVMGPAGAYLDGSFFTSQTEPLSVSIPVTRRIEARLHRVLEDLEPVWRRLEDEGTLTAYQRFDWVKCIRDHLVQSSAATPLYVELVDAKTSETVMILPLAMVRRFGARVITWFNFGVCDYAAPICAGPVSMTTTEAELAWAAVRAILPKCDLTDIVQIPTRIGALANPLALLSAARPMTLSASGVAIEGDAATLIRRVGGNKTEKELGALRRRLDRRGKVQVVQAKTASEAEPIFEAMLDQRQRRFTKLGRFDLLARTDVRSFYMEALLASLETGPAHLWGLSVDGEWIAASYNLAHDKTSHGIILTHDGGAWRNHSPGLVLVGELMVHYAQRGYEYFDFTIGDLPYKAGFGAKPRELRQLSSCHSLYGLAILGGMRAWAASSAYLAAHPRLYEAARNARRRLRQIGHRSSQAAS